MWETAAKHELPGSGRGPAPSPLLPQPHFLSHEVERFATVPGAREGTL